MSMSNQSLKLEQNCRFQGKKGQVIPDMNEGFINLVSNRYVELFEKITDQSFDRVDVSNLLNRVENYVGGARKIK